MVHPIDKHLTIAEVEAELKHNQAWDQPIETLTSLHDAMSLIYDISDIVFDGTQSHYDRCQIIMGKVARFEEETDRRKEKALRGGYNASKG